MTLLLILLLAVIAYVAAGWTRAAAPPGWCPDVNAIRRRRRWLHALIVVGAVVAFANLAISMLVTDLDSDGLLSILTMVGLWNLVPLALLWVLLGRTDSMPRFQIGMVAAVVAYPAYVLVGNVARMGPHPRGGLEPFWLPAMQIAMMALLCLLAGGIAKLAARGDKREDPAQ